MACNSRALKDQLHKVLEPPRDMGLTRELWQDSVVTERTNIWKSFDLNSYLYSSRKELQERGAKLIAGLTVPTFTADSPKNSHPPAQEKVLQFCTPLAAETGDLAKEERTTRKQKSAKQDS